MLRRVLDRDDETWTPLACEALRAVYRASGRMDLLGEVLAQLDRHEADLLAARRERSTITAGDDFIPHELTDEQLAPLRDLLATIPDAAEAWLARKKLRAFPNRTLFVLCVRGAGARWRPKNSEREKAIVRRLAPKVELPGQVLVIARQGSFRALARKLMKLPAAEVFRRDEPPRG